MTNTQTVALTATRTKDGVTVTGPDAFSLPPNSGACRFDFTLDDGTGLDVRFESLDREDDSSTCPPKSGNNSRQIVGVNMHNNQSPKRAAFTDNNNNKGGPMDVSFQWNFTCNDPKMKVEPYDPIIRNGGEN